MVRSICQMAYVTRSIETSVDYWIDVMGAGPFFFSEIYCPEQQTYRGTPTEVRFRLACGYSGDIQIEIIQQENDARSPFMEIVESRTRLPLGGAFHHVQLQHDGYDSVYGDFIKAGAEHCFDAFVPGVGRLSFLDVNGLMDCYLEIVDVNPGLLAARTRMREIHRQWDGSHPHRNFSELLHHSSGSERRLSSNSFCADAIQAAHIG